MHPISLQINVSGADLEICKRLLERQVAWWYDEVEEVVIAVETRKSFGKFALDFERNREAIVALVDGLSVRYPKVRRHGIDYSPDRVRAISERFFAGRPYPMNDYRGSAYHSYLDGVFACRNRYVVHIDSDMLLGGTPNAWLQRAVDLLNSDPSYLLVNPLAGPPAADGDIRQRYVKQLGAYTFLFDKLSTRVFLIDTQKLQGHPLRPTHVALTPKHVKWFLQSTTKRWGYKLLEETFADMMRRDGLYRVDTLGPDDAHRCFSLHPLVKPRPFIEALPDLLARIDADDFPEAQRGAYDVHNDFFDFKALTGA